MFYMKWPKYIVCELIINGRHSHKMALVCITLTTGQNDFLADNIEKIMTKCPMVWY